MRYSKRDAEAAFDRLREAVGKDLATDYSIRDPRRNGAWLLDNQPTYGGYVIVEIVADSPPQPGDNRPQAYTSHHHPLSSVRRSAREFCEYVDAVMQGMALREQD